MKKKMKIVIMVVIVAVFIMLAFIILRDRVFIVRFKYYFDGIPIDLIGTGSPRLDGFDGVEHCMGYGVCMKNQKVYLGIDWEGLSEYHLRDGCIIDGQGIGMDYSMEFYGSSDLFYNETVYVNYTYDDSGVLQYELDYDDTSGIGYSAFTEEDRKEAILNQLRQH